MTQVVKAVSADFSFSRNCDVTSSRYKENNISIALDCWFFSLIYPALFCRDVIRRNRTITKRTFSRIAYSSATTPKTRRRNNLCFSEYNSDGYIYRLFFIPLGDTLYTARSDSHLCAQYNIPRVLLFKWAPGDGFDVRHVAATLNYLW